MEESKETYLDYAGATVPPKELIQQIFEDILNNSPLCNPHSRRAEYMERARALVLKHFNVSGLEYDVVFTAGTTAGCKLVGEIFPWGECGVLCYPLNSHTSVVGMRVYANGFICLPSSILQENAEYDLAESSISGLRSHSSFNLLVVPGECNFTGAKANLMTAASLSRLQGTDYLQAIAQMSINSTSAFSIPSNDLPWMWMLDAAKLCASSTVNLQSLPPPLRPHFLAMSFYKIFGYPTGLGALLVRRDVAPMLKKRYWGGGTLQAACATTEFSVPRVELHERLEDGTQNFYAISALPRCFEYLESIGGMSSVQARCADLTRYLLDGMRGLIHSSGYPVCHFYGLLRRSEFIINSASQGPTISFNVCWSDGSEVGFTEVGLLAELNKIILRTGCFCNVGSCQEQLGLSADEMEQHFLAGRKCGGDAAFDIINDKITGAVRVSLGMNSTLADCDRFLSFLTTNFLNRVPNVFAAPTSSSISSSSSSSTSTSISTSTSTEVVVRQGTQPVAPLVLTDIYLYPIKSCAAMRVSRWPLSENGLKMDREWALVDENGRAVTQKRYPKMTLLEPTVDLDSQMMTVRCNNSSDPDSPSVPPLTVSFGSRGFKDPSISPYRVPCSWATAAPSEVSSERVPPPPLPSQVKSVKLCGQECWGEEVSEEANKWFSDMLGIPCFLVRRLPCQEPRESTSMPSPFANDSQFLVISSESVAVLSQAMSKLQSAGSGFQVSALTFRPNLVVSGGKSHQEDGWSSLEINARPSSSEDSSDTHGEEEEYSGGNVSLDVTGPCARCSMVNVNGQNGLIEGKTLKALADYRREGSNIYFGQFLSIGVKSIKRLRDSLPVYLETGSTVKPTENTKSLLAISQK